MIRKFKNFDADEFIKNKKALKEAVDTEVEDAVDVLNPEDIESGLPEDDVIMTKAVYEDPYLVKISNIVKRQLKKAGIGNFLISYNIVYLNNVPGVAFYDIDGGRTIVCCRSTQEKSISIFNSFAVGKTNTAVVTYSTTKLGFKDMLDQMVDDLKGDSVNESLINEKLDRYGAGWTKNKEVSAFESLDHDEREFVYSFIRKFGKSTAAAQFLSLVDTKDAIALRVWKKYRGSDEAKGGPVKYMMDLANTVLSAASGVKLGGSYQAAVDEHILDNLIADCKGEGPAIITSSGIAFEVDDVDDDFEARRADMEAKHKAEIAADAENYEETIRGLRETTEAMCNYVKQNGELDKEDKSIMSRRGVLLTGKGGIGKTYTLKEVLKEKHMVLNKDYVWAGSGNSTADSLYKLMYEYNGKLLVFDDSPNLFEGTYRISLWKNALQTEIEDCLIGCPSKDTKLNVYNVRKLKGDRQKRYFTEIGSKSVDDKSNFYTKEMKRRGLKYGFDGKPTTISHTDPIGEDEIKDIMARIDDMWEDEERNVQPSMPNEFIFKGLVIIISNYERERFIDEVGAGNWDAISSRFRNFDISPKAEALWSVMKKKILDEYNDKSIADDLCAIPRDMTEEFIKEVESLLSDPSGKYQSINWRTISMFHDILGGSAGRRTWKKTLREELSRK